MTWDGEPLIHRPAVAFKVEGRVGRSAHSGCCTRWSGFDSKGGDTSSQRHDGPRGIAQPPLDFPRNASACQGALPRSRDADSASPVS